MHCAQLIRLKDFLDEQVARYNHPKFIQDDPVAIPHAYKRQEDIEIAGFLAATLAWGHRKVIIKKSGELLGIMDHAPHDFVINHQASDLKPLQNFRHRTFHATDALYFIHFLQHYYQQYGTLETAFVAGLQPGAASVETALVHFHRLFFSLAGYPERTRKHVATPARNATCKRLNMFLRWMVRQDEQGVDFGLWKQIQPQQLVCPCDVHVARVSRELGLMQRKNTDWQAALELTQNLKQLSPEDPVKYDFALFGMGVSQRVGQLGHK
ncbi:MAG: TIGR02757 family protein [Bacteroidota bacterium]